MNDHILVVGSINMDLVIQVDKLPVKGETVVGKSIQYVPGGKGSNQAVAASRLGGKVSFIGKVGSDDFGKELLRFLKSENLLLDGISVSSISSGLAQIVVDKNGDNTIVVFSGSNSEVTPEYIKTKKKLLQKAAIVVAQYEIPVESVETVLKISKKQGITTLLNPAPAKKTTSKILESVDYLILNETELSSLTGLKVEPQDTKQIIKGVKNLKSQGANVVIVTVGERGAIAVDANEVVYIKGIKVNPVDTTAAGDCFVGAFAAQISKGMGLVESLEFANRAAAISVQRKGASSSLPTLKEVKS